MVLEHKKKSEANFSTFKFSKVSMLKVQFFRKALFRIYFHHRQKEKLSVAAEKLITLQKKKNRPILRVIKNILLNLKV